MSPTKSELDSTRYFKLTGSRGLARAPEPAASLCNVTGKLGIYMRATLNLHAMPSQYRTGCRPRRMCIAGRCVERENVQDDCGEQDECVEQDEM